jgi:hypothetical protein
MASDFMAKRRFCLSKIVKLKWAEFLHTFHLVIFKTKSLTNTSESLKFA